jgi:hypothetical protein
MVSRSAKTAAPELVLAHDVLGAFAIDEDGAGVVLGRDSADRPVLLRLFGAQPLTVAFIGGWWAGQLLVFRCLAHGAAVVVDALDTATPAGAGTVASVAQWLTLVRAAGGVGERALPMAGDASGAWPVGAARPLLRLRDLGPDGPADRPVLQAWQTQLTMLSRLTPAILHTVAGADVVLVQRLEQPEAELVGSALLLRPEVVSTLTVMDNEMVALFRGGVIRYTWLTPTTVERELFG